MRILMRLFLFLMSSSLFAQTGSIIDSLKLELVKDQADTTRAMVLNDLAYYYLYQDTDTAVYYGHKAYDFAEEIGYHKVRANAKLYTGNAFLFSNRMDSAEVFYKQAFGIAKKHELKKSAIYSSLGMLYKNNGKLDRAVRIYYEGIIEDEKEGNEYGKFIKLNNLANVYSILENKQKSIELLLEAVEISENSENPNIRYASGTILNGVGAIYIELGQLEEGLTYFQRSLEANKANENKREIARNYQNIGATQSKLGNYTEALDYLKKAFSLREELADKKELTETYFELGNTYGKLKQNAQVKFHFDRALELGLELGDQALLSKIYQTRSNTYEELGESALALESYKLHTLYRDSILQEENLKNVSEIETKYETAKKDKELLAQNLEIEQANGRLQSRNAQLYFLLFSLVLLGYVFWQRQKRKNQEIDSLKKEHQIKTLESLIQGEEKERFRIARELHDGVNGDLSAIKFKLSALSDKENPAIGEAVAMIDDSCKQVRAISHNLVPPSLENFNLVEALEEYIENTNGIHQPEIDFQHLGEHPRLSKNAEINIFRIVQELVVNALKHAEAQQINVQLSCREEEIQLTVEDDGKGFDTSAQNKSGIGLSNIQSRVDYLQADKDVLSNQEGTSYTLSMNKNLLP
ncbi:hypothetical protein BST99_00070 [Aureicoccus marinus]|uniref:histidine kinase n=2 Tax=Aureicoccus marinus TaxID=754435 RepID=A0A2S7T3W3_9FLAO|nr:hypothetical protein BST99_00070 [Aureicoccus marinus]